MTAKQTKRIAILVARNNFVYRGVGSYVKSIIDWALKNDFFVDIVSDDKVRNNGLFDSYDGKVNWFTPITTYNDSTYKELSAFSKPFDTALSINFRNSLIEALKKHTYDLIVTNVGEALDAVTGLGVHKYCTVIHPTHHESEAGLIVRHDIFSPGVSEKYQTLCNIPDVILACQSSWIKTHADAKYPTKTDDCRIFPLLVPEPDLLNFTKPAERWGVGFVGPWEPRKNPEAYIAALKKTKLPGVAIVPSEASAKKFESKFKEAGVQYKIHVGVCGQAKVDIFKSLAAAYHPAVSETFGLGALETAHCCPTVLLEKNEWSHVHSEYCTITTEQYAADKIAELYGQDVSAETQAKLIARQKFAESLLLDIVERPEVKKTTNNFYAELDKSGLVNHADFVDGLASFCTDEIYKMLRLPGVESVEVLHTLTSTYYRTKGSNLLPEEENAASALFDFG